MPRHYFFFSFFPAHAILSAYGFYPVSPCTRGYIPLRCIHSKTVQMTGLFSSLCASITAIVSFCSQNSSSQTVFRPDDQSDKTSHPAYSVSYPLKLILPKLLYHTNNYVFTPFPAVLNRKKTANTVHGTAAFTTLILCFLSDDKSVLYGICLSIIRYGSRIIISNDSVSVIPAAILIGCDSCII